MSPWKFLLILKMRTTRVRRTTRSSESASTDTEIRACEAKGGGIGDLGGGSLEHVRRWRGAQWRGAQWRGH